MNLVHVLKDLQKTCRLVAETYQHRDQSYQRMGRHTQRLATELRDAMLSS
jgi:hypothetical protein